AAAARPLPLRLAGERGRTGDPGAALPHLAKHPAEGGGLTMPRWLRTMGRWLDARLGLRESLGPLMDHPVPKSLLGPKGWWYVFGSASLTLLLLQILTGIGLAMVYVPSADRAYDTLLYLNYEQPLGWF